MPSNENVPKRPLLEVLDDAIKNAMQSASLEERAINQIQYEVLESVYESVTDLIGGEARINLRPIFTSGGVSVVTEAVNLSSDEVSRLRTVLSECSTLSIETLDNGNLEIGVTVPNVFCPAED